MDSGAAGFGVCLLASVIRRILETNLASAEPPWKGSIHIFGQQRGCSEVPRRLYTIPSWVDLILLSMRMKLFCVLSVWSLPVAQARTWRDLGLVLNVPDPTVGFYLHEKDPLFTPAPSQQPSYSPSAEPSISPTTSFKPSVEPTLEPTAQPSSAPTLPPDPYPFVDPPTRPPNTYFNYDTRPTAQYGPGHAGVVLKDNAFAVGYSNNQWDHVATDPYWNEFGNDGGWGPWKGTLANHGIHRNRCGKVGMQSPIDLRPNDAGYCEEHHEVRSRPGDFRVSGDKVDKQILPHALRLVYPRRPCADFVNNVTCMEPDPPHADFPEGWGNTADVMHIDIKVPSEHLIRGERFDGEMQIFHLHPGRRRMPVQSVVIRATADGYNYYFQAALDAFADQYRENQAKCGKNRRLGRQLVQDFENAIEYQAASEFHDYQTWADYSTDLDHPDYEANVAERKLQIGIWDPYHVKLIPTIWFYRYDGSLTHPPCSEWVTWLVCDKPMIISVNQLETLKTILFTNVDDKCRRTSAHFEHSVARPIQETAGRPVWQCKPSDFGPDQ